MRFESFGWRNDICYDSVYKVEVDISCFGKDSL